MMAKPRSAFVFISPGADPRKHKAVIETPGLELTVVGVSDVEEATAICRKLSDEGIDLVELCAAFGNVGTAKIVEAIGEKTPVGSVAFGINSVEKVSSLLKRA
jgi:hypothetical protein